MWILSFIPDSLLPLLVNTLLVIGSIISFVGVVSQFPAILPYKQILQIFGILILVIGIYFKGCVDTELNWRAAAAKLQTKIDIAEKQSNLVNNQIETKVITKMQVVHDTKVVTKQVIKEVEKKINSECNITSETISILNAAARNEPAIINKDLTP